VTLVTARSGAFGRSLGRRRPRARNLSTPLDGFTTNGAFTTLSRTQGGHGDEPSVADRRPISELIVDLMNGDLRRGEPQSDDHDTQPHAQPRGAKALIASLFSTHGHAHQVASHSDRGLEASREGIHAVKLSLIALTATALLQLAVVVVSGSVALLSDTIHNFADALTSLPLWLAFSMARKPPNAKYTYGYGRAEDIAGIVIVIVIASSAAIAAYEGVQRLLNPQTVDNLAFVVGASIIGFVGNELVAVFRIRVGRKIGSAALVADGLHSRTDGLTSLAVLFGAGGVALGFPIADPLVGIVITVAILFILKDAAHDIYLRLMDAVDPVLVEQVHHVVESVEGVRSVDSIRIRWIGHLLRAEVSLTVDRDMTVHEGHAIALTAHHAILHSMSQLSHAIVHVNPTAGAHDPHAAIAHHFPALREKTMRGRAPRG
jgi:cation diffusion facilitator family transporter